MGREVRALRYAFAANHPGEGEEKEVRELSIPAALYGRKDLKEVTVPQKDGTQHKHSLKPELIEGRSVVVLKCKSCVEELVNRDPSIVTPTRDPNVSFSTHWTITPRLVPKTEDEIEKEQNDQLAFASQSGQTFADFLKWQADQKKRGVNY
jgi:hypothetical protein